MLQHFKMFAAYNAWANSKIYALAGTVAYDDYNRDLGAFFGSIHGTLNHILYADRTWMARFQGQQTGAVKLDTILCDDFRELRLSREIEDRKIITFIDQLSESDLNGTFSYKRGNPPETYTDKMSNTLAHIFNHQTHHRGQVHMMLTTLGRLSLELDLVYFLRSENGKAFS